MSISAVEYRFNIEDRIELTLTFAKFKIEFSSQVINNLGNFLIFCLKAFNDNLSISDISKITDLNENIILEQLEFAKDKNYITPELKLTQKGEVLINLLDFLETYKDKIFFYVNCYSDEITNDNIYNDISIEQLDNKHINILNPNLEKFKLLILLENNLKIEHLYEYIKSILKDNLKISIDDFRQLQVHYRFIKFKQVTIPVKLNEFLNNLNCNNLDKGIEILLPAISCKLDINQTSIFPEMYGEIETFMKEKDMLGDKIFSLLDKSLVHSNYQIIEKADQKSNKLTPILNFKDVIENNIEEMIPAKFLFYTHIKSEIKECYVKCILIPSLLNKLINENLMDKLNENDKLV